MESETDKPIKPDSLLDVFEYEYLDVETDSTEIDVLSVCDNENDLNGCYDDELDDIEEDIALDFNEMRSLVEGRGCASILDLHLNIKHIIDETPILGPKRMKIKQE